MCVKQMKYMHQILGVQDQFWRHVCLGRQMLLFYRGFKVIITAEFGVHHS